MFQKLRKTAQAQVHAHNAAQAIIGLKVPVYRPAQAVIMVQLVLVQVCVHTSLYIALLSMR